MRERRKQNMLTWRKWKTALEKELVQLSWCFATFVINRYAVVRQSKLHCFSNIKNKRAKSLVCLREQNNRSSLKKRLSWVQSSIFYMAVLPVRKAQISLRTLCSLHITMQIWPKICYPYRNSWCINAQISGCRHPLRLIFSEHMKESNWSMITVIFVYKKFNKWNLLHQPDRFIGNSLIISAFREFRILKKYWKYEDTGSFIHYKTFFLWMTSGTNILQN